MSEKSERAEDFEEMLEQMEEEGQSTVAVAEEVYNAGESEPKKIRFTNSTNSDADKEKPRSLLD